MRMSPEMSHQSLITCMVPPTSLGGHTAQPGHSGRKPTQVHTKFNRKSWSPTNGLGGQGYPGTEEPQRLPGPAWAGCAQA